MNVSRDGQTFAPWSPADVAALNEYQGRSDLHPFTCPADGNYGSYKHSDRRILVATEQGWVCEMCPYTQNWAHKFMKLELGFCLAARLDGPDHQPYLCERNKGHDGAHLVTSGDWSYEW